MAEHSGGPVNALQATASLQIALGGCSEACPKKHDHIIAGIHEKCNAQVDRLDKFFAARFAYHLAAAASNLSAKIPGASIPNGGDAAAADLKKAFDGPLCSQPVMFYDKRNLKALCNDPAIEAKIIANCSIRKTFKAKAACLASVANKPLDVSSVALVEFVRLWFGSGDLDEKQVCALCGGGAHGDPTKAFEKERQKVKTNLAAKVSE